MRSLCSEESGNVGWGGEFKMAPTGRILVDEPCEETKSEVLFIYRFGLLYGEENADRKRKLTRSSKPILNQINTSIGEIGS